MTDLDLTGLCGPSAVPETVAMKLLSPSSAIPADDASGRRSGCHRRARVAHPIDYYVSYPYTPIKHEGAGKTPTPEANR